MRRSSSTKERRVSVLNVMLNGMWDRCTRKGLNVLLNQEEEEVDYGDQFYLTHFDFFTTTTDNSQLEISLNSVMDIPSPREPLN